MAPMQDPPGGDAHKALEEERHLMTAYSDTAKTYSQLSLGALVLSITFFEKIADTAGKITIDTPLVVAWTGWLTSALAGAFYQYLAVRFLEARGELWGVISRSGHPQSFRWLAHHPWPVYAPCWSPSRSARLRLRSSESVICRGRENEPHEREHR